jgi:hypothetical protein
MEFILQLAQFRILQHYTGNRQKQRRKKNQAKRHNCHCRDMGNFSGVLQTGLDLATPQ